jgi:hypothetical protein
MASATGVSRAERGSAGPVNAVSVVSMGTVEIHPEQPYGTRKPLYWWLLTSRRWTPPRPINAYVIEHANGLILLHEDHIGGLPELGGADLLVTAAEWEQLSGFGPELRAFHPPRRVSTDSPSSGETAYRWLSPTGGRCAAAGRSSQEPAPHQPGRRSPASRPGIGRCRADSRPPR